LGSSLISLLEDIPELKRLASFVPQLYNEEWAKATLLQWAQDDNTPETTKNSINLKFKDK
jgi:hypothetical protein